MSARAVMIQGTASDAGKSVVVAGLCRAVPRGAAAGLAGGAVQAAEHVEQRRSLCRWRGDRPRAGRRAQDFNPVLLKPQTDRGAQVVVHGQPVGMLQAADYRAGRARLLSAVMESFARLVVEFDLAFLRAEGWDHDLLAHARAGGRVVGVCGGFQMLGRRVHDPVGADGPAGSVDGLGLLDVETTMQDEKTVRPARGRCALSDAPVTGYEIHTGRSHGSDLARPLFLLETGADGARSANGLVEGTYLHGLFANDAYRRAWLERVAADSASSLQYEVAVDAALDEVADSLCAALDLDALFRGRAPTPRRRLTRPASAVPAAQEPGQQSSWENGCAFSSFNSRASPATMRYTRPARAAAS